jgi:hypothetical protein
MHHLQMRPKSPDPRASLENGSHCIQLTLRQGHRSDNDDSSRGSWLKRFLVLPEILEPIGRHFGGIMFGRNSISSRAVILRECRTLHTHKRAEDPHGEIVRLEEHIEELAAKIESCRKFVLASRLAVAGGGIVLASMLLGAIRFDPAAMVAAVAALLGGIVVWGSNGSTAKEAAKELATAEADRAALIEKIDLRVIP